MGYNRQQHTMKNYFLIFILSICFISCTKEDNVKLDDAAISAETQKSEIEKVMDVLYAQNFSTIEEAAAFLGVNFEENTPQISSDAVSGSTTDAFVMSEEGIMALSEIENVEITNDMSLGEYESELLAILSLSELNPESFEYAAFENGIKATIAVIEYDLHLQGYDDELIRENGLWAFLSRLVKCVGKLIENGIDRGTDGAGIGTGIGIIGGAAFGTVAGVGPQGAAPGAVAGGGVGAVGGYVLGFVYGVIEEALKGDC